MDISLQPVDVYQPEDRSWLGSRDGTDVTQTITLQTSLFTAGTHFPNGYIPSGCVLGQVTSSGLYGPYDDTASDGRQTAVGFLYSNTKVRTGGPNVGAPIHWRGIVRRGRLPFNNATSPYASNAVGGLDAAGIVDLAKFWVWPR